MKKQAHYDNKQAYLKQDFSDRKVTQKTSEQSQPHHDGPNHELPANKRRQVLVA